MKKSLLALSLLILAFASQAQVVGKTFPLMEAETVEDKKVKLPGDVGGKYTLIGLAYSKNPKTN